MFKHGRQSHLCVSWAPRAINFHTNVRPWQRQRNPTLSPIESISWPMRMIRSNFRGCCAALASFRLERGKENPRCTLLNKKCCIRSGTKREKLKLTMKEKSCLYTRAVRLCVRRNGKLNMRSLRISAACWCLSQSTSSESLRIISSTPTHGRLCYHMEAQC